MSSHHTMKLQGAQVDRAAGVLLGTACGDALGAGYEFGPPLPEDRAVRMAGGGTLRWEPGEWTDDTSMAVAVAETAATGADLRSGRALDQIAQRWAEWARRAKDVGNQTRAVLGSAGEHPIGQTLAAAAADYYELNPDHAGGNGSLMRTAPVALAFLHDEDGLVEAARAVSSLTHADPEAGEACVLWCLAIRHAVLHGTFDGLRLALERLPGDRASVWTERLDEAEAHPPSHFDHNGWVVQALQGAWSAIVRTPVPQDDPAAGVFAAQHLQLALEGAVRGGRDTDTVAAIAGGLLGARWGASAIPLDWQRRLHGWPGLRARDLVRLGLCAALGGTDDTRWPTVPVLDYSAFAGRGALAVHPQDDGVWLGGVDAVRDLPPGVDAVVSLCRLGAAEVPAAGVAPGDHVEVWLVDDPQQNQHVHFVLSQAADAVAALRAEGHTVLLHCVQAESRTPAVGALYSATTLRIPLGRALAGVAGALPQAHPNAGFRDALARLTIPRG